MTTNPAAVSVGGAPPAPEQVASDFHPAGLAALNHVADRAADWSATADHIKTRLDRARWAVFGLSVAGALAAAVASQIPSVWKAHAYLAAMAAVLLAIGALLSQRFLGRNETQSWVRARSASEALKREAFRFAARSKPYGDTANPDALLQAERERIERDVDDLVARQVKATRAGSSPRQLISPTQYRNDRLLAAAQQFYRPKAEKYRKTAGVLKAVELCLAFAAVVVTAIAGIEGKAALGIPWPFDLAALTAVLTTVSGAILAHIGASRLDHLVVTYLATARRLEDLDSAFAASSAAGGSAWSQFVSQCEDIIAAETSSWVAKWSSDTQR